MVYRYATKFLLGVHASRGHTHKSGYNNNMSLPRETRLRRLLGIGPPPNTSGMVLTPNNQRAGASVSFLSEDERKAELARWHKEGIRARVAEWVAYLPQLFRYRARTWRSARQMQRTLRKVGEARVLTYRTHHLLPAEGCLDIDGYLDIAGGYPLDIVTTAWIESVAQANWQEDDAGIGTSSLSDALVVPAEQLDAGLIQSAIEKWYRETFAGVRGHWALSQGVMPSIVVDVDFLDAVEYAQATETPYV